MSRSISHRQAAEGLDDTPLELQLWRKLRVPGSPLTEMLGLLKDWASIQGLGVRRLEESPPQLVLAASEGMPEHVPAQLELSAEALPRLLSILREPSPYRVALDVRHPFWGESCESDQGDATVVPLGEAAGTRGLLVLFSNVPPIAPLPEGISGPLAAALAFEARNEELRRLRAMTQAEDRALLTYLRPHSIVEAIIGERGGLRSVMERIQQVAHTDVPVLILGETGSGKEVIARAIHERSRHHHGPMVRVNCGAIPSELIDSELFGHERGSFTGAVGMRKGWFERADGGTLLLDEVGELPLAAQVRLLRVIQEGTFTRVGGQNQLKVDVRLVAATHRDLRQMVSDGTFREDLWYRISVFPLSLPPLRERAEDLPALAAHFAASAGERLGAGPLTPTAEDIELLRAYAWPGNVRELAAVMDRAVILGHGRRLEVAAALGVATPSRENAPPSLVPEAMELSSLDAVVTAHVERVLSATKGRIEGPRGAAAFLRVNPHTLRARMRRLRIDWSRFRDADGT